MHAYIWGHFDAPSKIVTIESLYVSEEYRHKGIATTLKRNVERWAKSLRAQQVIGTVLASNTAMLTLNEKLGYRVQKVIMQKELNSD
ncbi:GNAT family N-acetyltransferase [Staphylococcus hyicus]|uniref:GNAT family N-acetyltransferase n=1 Tax=Staphylococcus hyicus TaxID=1284 RepID=UPI003B75CABE